MTPLSLTNRRWVLPDKNIATGNVVEELMNKRNIRLINPAEKMQSPDVFPGIQKAVQRIEQAIKQKQQIAIFGDYDCDGITGTAQLVRFFKRRDIEPIARLPHRIHDGYGLKNKVIDEFREQKINLLITVDTGIGSASEIAYAKKHGIDTIVTDHHHVPENLPDAVALLHPALAPSFPEPHPSGSGVALSLVRAIEGDRWDDMETDIILAMIGTVADLVPIRGENRILAYHGLRLLSQIQHGALAHLKAQCGIDETCTSTDVGFRIAPRINAAGRLDDPTLALNGLLGDIDALEELDGLNKRRQLQTRECTQEAMQELGLHERSRQSDLPFLCVASPNYGHGIIGLIAGKLTQVFGKPSMAVAIDGDLATASLRSPPCYHITQGLERVQDLLTTFGGHAQAAGCSFDSQNLKALTDALSQDVLNVTSPNDLLPTIWIDTELHTSDLTLELCEKLDQLAPYGMGNEPPYFLLKGVTLEKLRTVGQDGAHLQASIGPAKVIGFGLGHLLDRLPGSVDIVCQINRNTWNGTESVQVVVEDVR